MRFPLVLLVLLFAIMVALHFTGHREAAFCFALACVCLGIFLKFVRT